MKCENTFALLLAASKNDTTLVNSILDKKEVDIDGKDRSGWTALTIAVRKRYNVIARQLIERGANPNVKGPLNMTALHQAILNNDIETMELLLKHKANISAESNSFEEIPGTKPSHSPLEWASNLGFVEAIRILLLYGANPNQKAIDGFSPLISALWMSEKEAAKVLLENGADPNMEFSNSTNMTPLHIAALEGFADITKMLIDHKANISSKAMLDICKILKNNVAESSLCNNLTLRNPVPVMHATPLFFAVVNGHINTINVLLENGVNINCSQGYIDIDALAKRYHWKTIPKYTMKELEFPPLNFAAYVGNFDTVKFLVKKGAEVNQKGYNSFTPFLSASMGGHTNIMKFLLEKGANSSALGKPFKDGSNDGPSENALMLAASNGNVDAIKFLLDMGFDVNYKNHYGITALHLAVAMTERERIKAINLLLERGANISAEANYIDDKPGTSPSLSPLITAVAEGRQPVENFEQTEMRKEKNPSYPTDVADVVAVLLKYGGNVNDTEKNFWTPLHFAAKNDDVATAKLLLDKKADIDAKATYSDNYNRGDSLDMKPYLTPLLTAVENRKELVAKILIERGANVNSKRSDLWTPLHFAAKHGLVKIVKLLLEHNANISAKANYNDDEPGTLPSISPIMAALFEVHPATKEILKVLLEYGDNVNATDKIFLTPLHFAVRNGGTELVKFLLEKKANVSAKALRSIDNLNTKPYLTPLLAAAMFGKEDMEKILISYGADVNVKRLDGKTPLHFAASNGSVEIVELILRNGPNISAMAKYNDTKPDLDFLVTPLMGAAMEGRVENLKVLLKYGAYVNQKNAYGWTPLHFAAANGRSDASKVLIEHGANISAKATCLNDNQYIPPYITPIMLAYTKGNSETVKLLEMEAKNKNEPSDTIVKLMV